MSRWQDIRDQALRPIFPVQAIADYLDEQAVILSAERIASRAYVKDRIEQALGEDA
jgi:hypothetical protein